MKLRRPHTFKPLAFTLIALGVGAVSGPTDARAEVALPALFSNSMILQRGAPIAVWGTAVPGEAVRVTLDKSMAETAAGPDGNWRVALPAHAAGENLTLSVAGRNTLTFTGVAVGEVWVCSGQSNMAFSVSRSLNANEELETATDPGLRLFIVPRRPSQTPETALSGQWKKASPEIVRSFSAVGYFFGRELRQKLGVPVGLIQSAVGGTPAESWTSRSALDALPQLAPKLAAWEKKDRDFNANLSAADRSCYETRLVEWQRRVEQAEAKGQPLPAKPGLPGNPADDPHHPSVLFNGMIAPLMPYTIKGVIWYQGESNAEPVAEASAYKALFPAMIRDWRTRWGQGNFPFLWVQLPGYRAIQQKPVENSPWADLRESQQATLSEPNTGMATAIDLADPKDPNNIHPPNKQDVGHRLALLALAKQYNRPVAFSGPTLQNARFEGAKVRLIFQHTDGGLAVHGQKLTGFALKGADGVWQWADAVIDGDSIRLSNPAVPLPTAVRYNWAGNPIGNLYNGAGLPAPPFRTDTDSLP